jgi:hypothetical protein
MADDERSVVAGTFSLPAQQEVAASCFTRRTSPSGQVDTVLREDEIANVEG